MKKRRLFILTSLTSLFVASFAYGSLPVSLKQNPSKLFISQALNTETIQQKAQAISVKVETENSAGSGVIIGKERNTYTVLTNAHVINSKADNTIITNDGKYYAAKVIREGNSLEGNDLAVLTFESVNSYQVATLAINPNLEENSIVYSVGFPEEMGQFHFTQGTFKKQAPKPFLGGYQIGYDIEVKSGMSGGALLNEKGELIGVNGLLQNPILDDAYTYLDGSQPYEQQIETYRNLSFAVPIQTLVEVAPNLALIPDEWKTGLNLAEKVDNIARQITVRIDSDNGVVGSGVLIRKEGDTYYVFTACHVVSDGNCQSGKINSNYGLVTPDGSTHSIQSQDIILPKGIDAAVVKFKSKNLYQLATIGQYNIPISRRQWVFISGFPGELKGLRKFSPGYRFQKEKGLALLFDQQILEIDISGYELVYSNLTYPGMSGGPVLDTNGQVIGINTGQEGEIISSTEIRQLGYAFGVPSSNLLKFAKDKNVNTTSLTISNQPPTPLDENDLKSLKQHPAFVVEKPPSNASENDWLNYGNNLWRIERVTEAISAFKTAIKLNPNLAEAYYALGLAYKDETNLKAIDAFDKVISLNYDWYLTGQAWYEKAVILNNLGKKNEALVAINEGIKLIDNDAKFYRQQANILRKIKRYPDAINALNQAIEIQSSGISYLARSLVYWEIGEYQKALNDCNRSLELGFIEGYFCQGRTHDALGNYEQSINAYNQAIDLDSTNSDYYMLRGLTYNKLKNSPKAIADLTKAIELEPQNDLFYYMRNNQYQSINQTELAIKDISKAINIKPNNAQYYYVRAVLKKYLEDYEGAMEDINEAIKFKPNYVSAYQLRSGIHISNASQKLRELQSNTNLTEQEKLEKAVPIVKLSHTQAIADLDKAIEINPKFGAAYFQRGSFRVTLALVSNEKEQLMQNALTDYNKAIKLMNDPTLGINFLWIGSLPEELEEFSSHQLKVMSQSNDSIYASVYKNRGNLLLNMKDNQGALADYTKAISLDPGKAAFYQQRSIVYRRLNENQKAITDASKVIELTPDKPDAYFSRGVIYHAQKDYKKAMNDYNLALSKDEKFIPAINNIGLIAYEQNNPEQAVKQWQRAINLKEDFAEGKLALAVAFYSQGKQDKAFSLAQDAINTDKRWKDIDHVKQNLWGEKMIKDAEILLETPQMKQL